MLLKVNAKKKVTTKFGEAYLINDELWLNDIEAGDAIIEGSEINVSIGGKSGKTLKIIPDKLEPVVSEEKVQEEVAHSKMGQEFDHAAEGKPDWDAIARGKVLSNIATAYVTNTGDLDPSEDVFMAMRKLRDRIMKG